MDIYHRVTVVQPGQRPDSYTELFADDRQFVGEGNVDVAEAVFGELAHLRRSGVRDNALALDEAAVEGDGRFGACRRQPADHAVVMDYFVQDRSAEHTSELQSLMRNSYAVFCLKKTTHHNKQHHM